MITPGLADTPNANRWPKSGWTDGSPEQSCPGQSDPAIPGTGTCSVTMDAVKSVTAIFTS